MGRKEKRKRGETTGGVEEGKKEMEEGGKRCSLPVLVIPVCHSSERPLDITHITASTSLWKQEGVGTGLSLTVQGGVGSATFLLGIHYKTIVPDVKLLVFLP